MEARELRIGNYVKREEKVLCIKAGDIRAMDDWQQLENEKEITKPIPLTEEWLLKFGFVNDIIEYDLTIGNMHEEGTMIFSIKKDFSLIQISVGMGGDKPDWIFLMCPTYVHQLQNLYFALTANELTIKEQ